MKKRFLALTLAVILCLGLVPSALAYNTPDFSDVPQGHWAYEAVMKMADAGVIKGVGEGLFAPEDKLTTEMFIVLVGRVVFPEVKADGADWSGPYVSEAKAKGLLDGTNVTDATLKGEISRYDMAVILAKCVEILKVSASKADSSKVADYGEVPTKYVDAVLMAYGSGLIRGDQAGSFNGANSMTRQEAATVMDRLLGLKGNSQGETTDPIVPPEPSASVEPETPVAPQPETIHTALSVRAFVPEPYSTNKQGQRPLSDVPLQLRYTEDGGKTSRLIAECTSYRASSGNYVSLTADIDKALVDSENGQFYFSGETEYNGQRLMTQDLRTDGRATIIPIAVKTPTGLLFSNVNVEMVPPTGFKRTVTVDWATSRENAIVQFRYYPDQENAEFGGGVLLCEANVSKEDGSYFMEFELDTVDYQRDVKCYRIETYDADDGTLLSRPDLRTFGEVNPRITLD